MNVVLYLFEGTYSGRATVRYETPVAGAHHKGILFLRQETQDPQWAQENEALLKFGFSSASFSRSTPLSAESLNAPDFRAFAGRYEEALSQGESLAWYP